MASYMNIPDSVSKEENQITLLKRKLQGVVVDTSEDMFTPLVDTFAKMGFDISTPPQPGMLMMNIRESDGAEFHLGEVLVTQAEVKQNGYAGFGCVMGDRPEAALALACLDALSQDAKLAPETLIQEEVERIRNLVFAKRENEARMTALTKVDFRSMAEE